MTLPTPARAEQEFTLDELAQAEQRITERQARRKAVASADMQRTLAPLAATARRTRVLRDGSVGWCVRAPRVDDCWAAAVATTLQLHISRVPDPRIDERLLAGESPEEIDSSAKERFDEWLAGRGLRMVEHRKVPVARRRWIGIVPLDGWFNDHCMVMSGDKLLFDPTLDIDSRPVRLFGARDVKWGFSFQRSTRE